MKNARKVFEDDVKNTYSRLQERADKIRSQTKNGEVEKIQLHAVDPSHTLTINAPPAITPDSTPEQIAAREIFDNFPEDLQKALEKGSLDDINVVLGDMTVEEAELVVEQLSTGGMLSLEEGIIDATTEEGQELVKQIEETHRMPGQPEATELAAEPSEE